MNNIENKPSIKTIYELEDIIRRYLEIKKLTKLEFESKRNEFEELRKKILTGIPIEENTTIELAIQKLLLFLVKNGYSYETFEGILHNTTFKISSISTIADSPGLAYSAGKSIVIDKTIIKFDQEGKFNGIAEEEKEILIHIITHELLHRISAFRDDKAAINVKDSAISEGLTEYIAELITNYQGEKKSKTYEFSKNIFKLFSKIIGLNNLLSDYINNLGTYPNLNKLFTSYGSNFNTFEQMMDEALDKRYQKANPEDIKTIETNILIELKENIIIPYIKDNPKSANEIISTFNELFSEYNISISNEITNNHQK